ncbi:MFS transporter [Actinoplanes sp. NBC_00393]|uniref:MFS transporter n=1 Tax=Actinoplanes sp. NBC_00393 TaxID=2975953 RepID=UPI002E205759
MTSLLEKPVREDRRAWLGLAVLALPTLLLSVDVSVLYLALPQLSAELGADATQQLWILDIYSFLLAGFLVTMGTLGDRIGRRRLLLIGAAAFGAASVIAAYAPTPELLIAARALLGVAGATLMPSTMALIRTLFPDPKKMARAVSIWFASFMGGMTLGPLVGGALLEHFWWGSAFLLGVPIMVLLLLIGPVLLPESRGSGTGRLDLASVALSLATILPLVYGLKETARHGVEPVTTLAVLAGIVCGVLFLRRQRRLAEPLLDLTLFRNPAVGTGLSVMLLTGVVMAGVSLLAAQYLQVSLGLSPLAAGLWLIPQNVAMVAGLLLAPSLAQRFPPSLVMCTGLLISAAGLLLHTGVDGADGRTPLVLGLSVASFGIALPMALLQNLVLAAAPPEKAGSAASLSETGAEFGIAVGVATLGSLAAVIYREELIGTAPQLPAEVLDTASTGIAGAQAAAQTAGPALFDAARTAFASGIHTVAVIGTVVYVVLGLVTLVVLRRRAND